MEPNGGSNRYFDAGERVAFSADGGMLAVLDDFGELRIFRIPG
jgi:hypothetical protein